MSPAKKLPVKKTPVKKAPVKKAPAARAAPVPTMPSVADLINMDRLIEAARPSVADLINMDRLIERADTELLINSAVSTLTFAAESLAPEVDLGSIERLADAVEVALPRFPLDRPDSAGREMYLSGPHSSTSVTKRPRSAGSPSISIKKKHETDSGSTLKLFKGG